jgi:hypothetical protein
MAGFLLYLYGSKIAIRLYESMGYELETKRYIKKLETVDKR